MNISANICTTLYSEGCPKQMLGQHQFTMFWVYFNRTEYGSFFESTLIFELNSCWCRFLAYRQVAFLQKYFYTHLFVSCTRKSVLNWTCPARGVFLKRTPFAHVLPKKQVYIYICYLKLYFQIKVIKYFFKGTLQSRVQVKDILKKPKINNKERYSLVLFFLDAYVYLSPAITMLSATLLRLERLDKQDKSLITLSS